MYGLNVTVHLVMVTDQRRSVVHKSLPGSKLGSQIMKLSLEIGIKPVTVAADCSRYQLQPLARKLRPCM